jgi:hypothetical protein
MPAFSTAQRLKIALGGFVSFAGFIITVCAILSATGAANLQLVFQNGLAAVIVTAVAALDVACGLLLVFRNKEIVLSFASHQEKTDNNTDNSYKKP